MKISNNKGSPYKPKYPFIGLMCPKNHSMLWLCYNEFNLIEMYCLECEGLLKHIDIKKRCEI